MSISMPSWANFTHTDCILLTQGGYDKAAACGSAITKTLSVAKNYMWTGYEKGRAYLPVIAHGFQAAGSYIYAGYESLKPLILKMLQVASSFLSAGYQKARLYTPVLVRTSKIAAQFLWTYKIALGATALLSTITYLAVKYIKNRPQYPSHSIKSSLNCARVSIGAPDGLPRNPKVNIIFCVDTSSSMRGDPETQVKEGVKGVLASALKVTENTEGAEISIGIVGFDHDTRIISEATQITRGSIQKFKQDLEGYSSNGGTDIVMGLALATNQLEQIAKVHTAASNILVLLTDGDSNISNIAAIHVRLKKLKAKLFAVGIGDRHSTVTLQMIAPANVGTYIATSEQNTIVKTISTIYQKAIESYSELHLTTNQLTDEQWSIDKPLSSLSEGKRRDVQIKLNRMKFAEAFDLSTLFFTLHFTDPGGRKGEINLPWHPNTIIDPSVWSS